MDKIIIRDLEIYAKHGVHPEEKILEQKFLISASIYLDLHKACISDQIENTVSFGSVCRTINALVKDSSCDLLENLAERISEKLLLSFSPVQQVDVEVKKPWAPIGLPIDTVSVFITRKWHEAYLSVGSNIGNKKEYLDFAVKRLSEDPLCRMTKVANYIETVPYGFVDQENFLNSAIAMKTLYSPEELLNKLHVIENDAGRKRTIHWGPRTLDIDILLFDDLVIDTEALKIPHIEMHKRLFVLRPLAQIAPYVRHPVFNKTIVELESNLQKSTLSTCDFIAEND